MSNDPNVAFHRALTLSTAAFRALSAAVCRTPATLVSASLCTLPRCNGRSLPSFAVRRILPRVQLGGGKHPSVVSAHRCDRRAEARTEELEEILDESRAVAVRVSPGGVNCRVTIPMALNQPGCDRRRPTSGQRTPLSGGSWRRRGRRRKMQPLVLTRRRRWRRSSRCLQRRSRTSCGRRSPTSFAALALLVGMTSRCSTIGCTRRIMCWVA